MLNVGVLVLTNKFNSSLFLLQHRARRLSGDSDLHLHLHHPISITPLLWRFQSSSSSSNLDHSIEDPQKESVLFHRRSKRRRADREREEVGDGFKDDFSLDRCLDLYSCCMHHRALGSCLVAEVVNGGSRLRECGVKFRGNNQTGRLQRRVASRFEVAFF
ncbi:hypothetical protein F2Q69_00033744 [Brassica cretica]|uniref:Uncharacterized protein n=1 Tax=Brassica cretica TaxID=69181 RepID=A0A8S9SD05_BRACR|nr:hypothetical protein F2Q69_00033744 [Brassica cretica]